MMIGKTQSSLENDLLEEQEMTKDYLGVSAQEASRRLCLTVPAFLGWTRRKKIPRYGEKSPYEWDWNEIEEKYMGTIVVKETTTGTPVVKETTTGTPVVKETTTGPTDEDIEKLLADLTYFKEGFLNHHLNASEFLQLVRRAISELK